MFKRVLAKLLDRDQTPAGTTMMDAAPPMPAELPIFPTRDGIITKAFTTYRVITAHGTSLVVCGTSPALQHEREPAPEHEAVLFRSNTMPEIGLLVSAVSLDLYEGGFVAPILPLILVEQAGTSRFALRSPIRLVHLCAVQAEGDGATGETDFHRHWIGPWELFTLRQCVAPVIRRDIEASLRDLSMLLERRLDPADIIARLEAGSASQALTLQVLVHLMARAQSLAAAVQWIDQRGNDVHVRAAMPAASCLPIAGPLRLAGEIRPVKGAPLDERLRGGWGLNSNGHCVALGARVLADFEIPASVTHARLCLDIEDSHHPIAMTVSLNGWRLGQTPLSVIKVHGSRLEYWIPREAMTGPSLSFAFDFDPPPPQAHGLPYAFALLSCSLHAGPRRDADAAVTATINNPAALMMCFESLGRDCEVGFLQRHFGCEPMGIFRFAGYDNFRNLLHMLDTDLEGLGAPGSLIIQDVTARIYRDPEPMLTFPEFFMRDARLQLGYHTWKGEQDLTREQAVAENETKLTYLRRKFIEDLEDAEKIWIFKDVHREDPNEVFALYDLLSKHGPNRLFWVTRTVAGRPAGSVEWLGPRLLRGYSDQPHLDAQRFVPERWLELCSRAYLAFAERA